MPAFGWGISSHFSHKIFWVFLSRGKVFFSPSDDSLVISCFLFSVPLSDGIKQSGS